MDMRTITQAIMLDFGAGTQSAKIVADELGLYYIPLDIKRHVSGKSNICIDLSVRYPNVMLVWLRIRTAVQEQWNVLLPMHPSIVKFIWFSPPCRTFSQVDATNRERGYGYRDFTDISRPPLQSITSKYGRIAREDDLLASFWIQLAVLWAKLCNATRWMLENPVGSLEHRPYMQNIANMKTVHYCAYGKEYRKPTRLWTNLKWNAVGNSGNGKCARTGKCPAMIGRYHRLVVTGGRSRQMKGIGAIAMRSSVPQDLLLEISHALRKDWYKFHRSIKKRRVCSRYTSPVNRNI